MKVLVVGATGNLGSYISQHFFLNGVEVVECKREPKSGLTLKKALDQIIVSDFRPDFVINATGAYVPDDYPNAEQLLRESLVDTTISLIEANKYWSATIVTFSTYFQFNQLAVPRFQNYISAKKESSQLFKEAADKGFFPVKDFVLYDNFGGRRRSKFLESVIDHTKSQQKYQASNASNKINLVSLFDISSIVLKSCLHSSDGYDQSQIRNSYDFTLRELVEIVVKFSEMPNVVTFNNQESRLASTDLWNCVKDSEPGWVFSDIAEYVKGQFNP